MKNTSIYFTFLLFTFLTSCVNEVKEPMLPDHLIPKEQMIVIMADIQVIEAYILNQKLKSSQKKDTSLLYYERIFKKNEVTKVQFEESLHYYQEDLPELKKLYTQVITRLNELKAKNEEILMEMKADSIRQDSIQEAERILDSLNTLKDTIFAPQ